MRFCDNCNDWVQTKNLKAHQKKGHNVNWKKGYLMYGDRKFFLLSEVAIPYIPQIKEKLEQVSEDKNTYSSLERTLSPTDKLALERKADRKKLYISRKPTWKKVIVPYLLKEIEPYMDINTSNHIQSIQKKALKYGNNSELMSPILKITMKEPENHSFYTQINYLKTEALNKGELWIKLCLNSNQLLLLEEIKDIEELEPNMAI